MLNKKDEQMKKGFLQACEVGGSIYGKKRKAGTQHHANVSNLAKKDVVEVYNKFYKDQVSALYKAIHNDK